MADHGSKVFCCSNCPRSEAKLLGLVDVLLFLSGFLSSVWLADLVKNHAEYFRNVTDSDTLLQDLGPLRTIDKSSQDASLASALVWFGWQAVLGGVVFYAAQTSRLSIVSMALVLKSLSLLVWAGVGVALIVGSSWKLATSAIVLMLLGYSAYELWILVILAKELRGKSARS